MAERTISARPISVSNERVDSKWKASRTDRNFLRSLLQEMSKQGWIQKLGGQVKNWKKR